MLNLQYPSDDGGDYQLGTDNDALQTAFGDLAPSVVTDPVFPFMSYPRGFFLVQSPPAIGDYSPLLYAVACTAGNTTWLAGPGTTVTLVGVVYIVKKCYGERRSSY